MTRIRFYHNTEDPMHLACELIAKAWRGGRRIAVRLADPASLQRFDALLWSHDQRDFVPHVPAQSPLAAETPIVLGSADAATIWPHDDVLVNLAPDAPVDVDRFRMLIEIVGQREADKLPARQRWQHYKASGHQPEAYDAETRTAL